MTIEKLEPKASVAVSSHSDAWAGAAADAYSPGSTMARKGTITEAGLAPAGPWCNPHLPTVSHDELMQSWGLAPNTKHVDPSPMPYGPEHPPADGFYGNPNPGQKGREHPDPTIQPCVGEPLTS